MIQVIIGNISLYISFLSLSKDFLKTLLIDSSSDEYVYHDARNSNRESYAPTAFSYKSEISAVTSKLATVDSKEGKLQLKVIHKPCKIFNIRDFST